ncbi:MAG: flagellar hook-associated protein FlgK [Candidatus Gastranaerophilales bacterium]|nr:flagellar hook-associated protein FlgK [Candidatus Gastranaerophilales bacterium]
MVYGLYLAQNSLVLNQSALNVVSNNISNMNTQGYSKQRVNLASMTSNYAASSLQQRANQGMGAYIQNISRNRDSFLDTYYRTETSKLNYYSEMYQTGSIIENMANELNDTGLNKVLQDFYSATQNLSLYPNNLTTKTDFIQKATSVATTFNSVSNQLKQTRKELVGEIGEPSSLTTSKAKAYTDEVNDLLKQLADLNKNIIYQTTNASGSPNGLLDQRDKLLDQLSEYLPITVSETSNSGISVSVGNVTLVKSGELTGVLKIAQGTQDNPAIVSVESPDGSKILTDDILKQASSGSLAAVLVMGGNSTSELSIQSSLDMLDKFAAAFAQEINDIQLKTEAGPPPMTSAWIDTSTSPSTLKAATEPIFVNTSGTFSASDIKINSAIKDDPKQVSTAYVEAVDDVTWDILEPDEIGNNESAKAFASLRNKNIPGLDNLTTEGYIAFMTSNLGSKVGSVADNLEVQTIVQSEAYTQRESTIGVNVDEELVDLIRFQRAYEASARIFNVASEIMQTMVNLGR